MDLGLRDKIALVTAGSAGLGLAVALELAREGAKVMINGRHQDRLDAAVAKIRAEVGEGVVLSTTPVVATAVADVAIPADIERLVQTTVETFGGLDILITNAGGPPKGTFVTTSLAEWQTGIDLTLMSVVRLVQAALPHLRQSDAASILTVTSISAKEPIDNLLLSNVIRPAVVGLTKSLSKELGGEGIRVNSILPGWTKTERIDYILDFLSKEKGTTPEVEEAKIVANVPSGRMGRPDEFGRVATFLVSPAASYVSGMMMLVDGGAYTGLM
jgi:3-oxoacyl-[acyl-carrier protein] reductase